MITLTKTKGTTAGMKSRGATIHAPGVRNQKITIKEANPVKGYGVPVQPAVHSKPLNAPELATDKKPMFPIK